VWDLPKGRGSKQLWPFFFSLFTGVRGKEEFSEVQGSKLLFFAASTP
jgi:hypothetical protein